MDVYYEYSLSSGAVGMDSRIMSSTQFSHGGSRCGRLGLEDCMDGKEYMAEAGRLVEVGVRNVVVISIV